MYLTFRRAAVITSWIGLAILIVGIIYAQNKIISVSSLDSRPFNIAVVGELEQLSPFNLEKQEEKLIASAMYEGLVDYDENSRSVKPNLAVNWKYSSDGKSLILSLKPNVRFHNGKLFTAYDVKKSWEKNFTETKQMSDLSLFLTIVGSRERLEGKAAEIKGIEVLNKYTVKVNFKEPNAAFIYMLTNPIFWIYDVDDKVAVFPGTGPFIFKEYKDETIILVKNEKYHRGKPCISAINVKLFNDPYTALNEYKAGKIDYLGQVPLKEVKNFKSSDEYKNLYIEKNLSEIYVYGFNLHKEPFAGNYQLRRALNYAIDREAIIQNVFGGLSKPLKGIIPSGISGYKSDMLGYSYDPEKAKKLLEEAGYPMGQGLKPLVLSYNQDEGHRVVAQTIAQQLGMLGIEVQLQPLEWEYFKKQLEKMDLTFFRLGWSADYPDADSFLYSLFHGKMMGITNYSGYYNPQVDKLLDASRAETRSYQERIKLLKRAEEIITDDAACLFLFQKRVFALKGRDVNNLTLDSMGMINWEEVELLKPSVGEKT
ncbi:ABC transporter substrate-binding protein [Thermosyntropha sp.]|uniref:ABC transporter substrate-binding protein n=1 Tax=Thermosyntropha sp. TaxID=2740820 RepID=UPI0025E17322|nr:ABC transporter substrate-binding protein [Thermosyntropha sp.]MBO8158881.1 ABC transporter substrate-binding protein [Thermosyntropha sp.]